MKFNSQICTTEEQSKRLLALGLKWETADCFLEYIGRDNYGNHVWHPSVIVNNYRMPDYSRDFPAWSLHRLIEMLNNTQFGMTIGIYNDEVTFAEDLFEVYDNTYDNLISVIEWLIGLGKFNENYLDIH